MKSLVVLLVAMAALVGAPVASAQTVVVEPPEAVQPFAAWARHAYTPLPDVTIVVNQFPSREAVAVECNGDPAYGCEGCPQEFLPGCPFREVNLWVHSGQDRWDFFHEIGHIYDEEGDLTEGQQQKFMRLIHAPADRTWWITEPTPAEELFGSHSPNEWFAEVFALCATQKAIPPHAQYNITQGVVGAAALRQTCRMVGRPL